MKKTVLISILLMTFCMTSCVSMEALGRDYKVYLDESYDDAKARIASYDESKEYLRKFRTVDKSGHTHDVTIYDRQYFKMDGVLFAYRFDDAMWYSLALTIPGGGVQVVDGTAKIMGFAGYATCIDNPETTISFIFAQKLFAQAGYESRYEAIRNVKGVSFAGVSHTGGYVDDFGKYRKYDYWDYFDRVFLTSKRDVRTLMVSAVSVDM